MPCEHMDYRGCLGLVVRALAVVAVQPGHRDGGRDKGSADDQAQVVRHALDSAPGLVVARRVRA